MVIARAAPSPYINQRTGGARRMTTTTRAFHWRKDHISGTITFFELDRNDATLIEHTAEQFEVNCLRSHPEVYYSNLRFPDAKRGVVILRNFYVPFEKVRVEHRVEVRTRPFPDDDDGWAPYLARVMRDITHDRRVPLRPPRGDDDDCGLLTQTDGEIRTISKQDHDRIRMETEQCMSEFEEMEIAYRAPERERARRASCNTVDKLLDPDLQHRMERRSSQVLGPQLREITTNEWIANATITNFRASARAMHQTIRAAPHPCSFNLLWRALVALRHLESLPPRDVAVRFLKRLLVYAFEVDDVEAVAVDSDPLLVLTGGEWLWIARFERSTEEAVGCVVEAHYVACVDFTATRFVTEARSTPLASCFKAALTHAAALRRDVVSGNRQFDALNYRLLPPGVAPTPRLVRLFASFVFDIEPDATQAFLMHHEAPRPPSSGVLLLLDAVGAGYLIGWNGRVTSGLRFVMGTAVRDFLVTCRDVFRDCEAARELNLFELVHYAAASDQPFLWQNPGIPFSKNVWTYLHDRNPERLAQFTTAIAKLLMRRRNQQVEEADVRVCGTVPSRTYTRSADRSYALEIDYLDRTQSLRIVTGAVKHIPEAAGPRAIEFEDAREARAARGLSFHEGWKNLGARLDAIIMLETASLL